MSEKEMEQMTIRFNPEWFQSAYYVYVLEIKHISMGTYYYIGQTGDRKHIAARSPFYRLMGHFNTYNLIKGTDAQLVKGLIANGLIEKSSENKKTRICVEEAIENKKVSIAAHYFKIDDFGDIEKHTEMRKKVENVELMLMRIFRKNSFKLFNDETKKGDKNRIIKDPEIIEKAEVIFKSLKI